MSGTSLDGVDLAHCIFTLKDEAWSYEITHAETIPYSPEWITRLTHLHTQPAFVYPKTDAFYGKYLGRLISSFIRQHNLKPDLVSSHGHTIFHQPANGFTAQVGNGANIYAETGIPTVCDFRSADVACGGQGAPLVPIGDELLFPEYDACLNLGGFSNISFRRNGQRIAFDISPCNVVMNPLAELLNQPYDEAGKMAAGGVTDAALLQELNSLLFYADTGAKSLGTEWVKEQFWPIVSKHELPVNDLLSTINDHIAVQIAQVMRENKLQLTLVTGGGAFNTTLINRIRNHSGCTLEIPADPIIQYKEALIFAFLGVRRIRGEVNGLRSVTGARKDTIGGSLWGLS